MLMKSAAADARVAVLVGPIAALALTVTLAADQRFRADVHVVTDTATVKDSHGTYVDHLQSEDFTLYEDDVRRRDCPLQPQPQDDELFLMTSVDTGRVKHAFTTDHPAALRKLNSLQTALQEDHPGWRLDDSDVPEVEPRRKQRDATGRGGAS
jgi:hypothetical protein